MSETLRCLTVRQVAALIGLSVVSIWRLRRRGDFPPPIQLSPGRVAFRECEVLAWLAARQGVGR